MVHGLEVPDAFAGVDVDGDDAFGKEVVALAESAPSVVGWRGDRQIDVSEIVVAAQHRPDVRVARVVVRTLLPGVRAELSVARHGVEHPFELAGPHVERLNVAGRPVLETWAVRH